MFHTQVTWTSLSKWQQLPLATDSSIKIILSNYYFAKMDNGLYGMFKISWYERFYSVNYYKQIYMYKTRPVRIKVIS